MPPILMVIVVIVGAVALFAQSFPWTSVVIVAFLIERGLKRAKLTQLKKQLYLDDVAAFQWHDNIDPIEFEQRCAQAMMFAGWTAHTTKGSGDQGVDVLAEQAGTRVVLQCKRYSKAVGNKAVQEAFAAKTFAKAHHAAVVTNNQYTPSAKQLAASTGVLLLHFTDLARPNTHFGLPDPPLLHRPSDVTKAEIAQVKKSEVTALTCGLCIGLLVALVHDISQPPKPPKSPEPELAAIQPAVLPAPVQDQPSAIATVPHQLDSRTKATQKQNERRQQPRAQSNLPKQSHPVFLADASTFCTAESDFDRHWQWSISGGQEPLTPSCEFLFGQPRAARATVLKRIGSNKTMVHIEDGNLAGKVGYTDIYVPE